MYMLILRIERGATFEQGSILHDVSPSHFFPDFLIPPPTRGPLPAAFFRASSSAFASSRAFCLFAISSSSISFVFFFGAFKGFCLPPCLPDILLFGGDPC